MLLNRQRLNCKKLLLSRINYHRRSKFTEKISHRQVVGSTLVAGGCNECHNHRFATVSGEAIREGRSHVHEIKFTTDYTDGHTHEFCGKSSPAIYVGGGKHVHFAKTFTDVADGHRHQFQVASLIDAPTDARREKDCDCDCDCGSC